MKSFGEYLRKAREDKELPLRKVAAALDIDTSILSKIERNERRATTEMIPILSKTLEKTEKEISMKMNTLESELWKLFSELMDSDCLNADKPDYFLGMKNRLKLQILNDGDSQFNSQLWEAFADHHSHFKD